MGSTGIERGRAMMARDTGMASMASMVYRPIMAYAIASLLTLTACGGSFAPVDLPTLPGAAEHPGADAVVLLDETRVRYRLDGEAPIAEVTTHRRLRVLDPDGQSLARHRVHYSPGLWTVTALDGRTISPAGDEEALGADDVIDAPAFPGFVLFSDSRVRSLERPVGVGGVFEARATVRHEDIYFSAVEHRFAGTQPVVSSALIVELPPGWTLAHEARALGDPIDFAPHEEPLPDGGRRLVWRRADISATRREPAAPPLHEMVARVRIHLTGWTTAAGVAHGTRTPADVSARLHAMQADRIQATPAIRARAERILAGVPDDPAARARALFEHVRDDVRYVAVQLGMGGWVPHAVDEIAEAGHGDCKDQSALLGALLTAAGIESRQAIVYAHRGWPRPYGLPAILGNSNHQVVFADLPTGPVLLDPTAARLAYGAVPSGLQGAAALPLTATGQPPTTIPVDPPDDHTAEITATLRLDAQGFARGEVTVDARGQLADTLRRRLRASPSTSARQALGRALTLHRIAARDAVIEAGEATGTDPLRFTAQARRYRRFGLPGQTWPIAPDALIQDALPRLDPGPRTQPIVLGVPRRRTAHITIALASGLTPGALPEPVEIDSPIGRYTARWTTVDGGIRLERTLERRRPWLPAAEADALRAFAAAVRAADARPLLIEPASPKDPR